MVMNEKVKLGTFALVRGGRGGLILATLAGVLLCSGRGVAETRSIEADVCVYAATPSGILAAVAVEREGMWNTGSLSRRRTIIGRRISSWWGGMWSI